MAERCQPNAGCGSESRRQAMAIHTRKITDSCRDKDCIEDLRVYLTRCAQAILDESSSAKVRCADLLCTYIDVEPVAFDHKHYCVDVTFYYRILADVMTGGCHPTTLQGLAVFSKRAVLCGEDSKTYTFTSDTKIGQCDGPTRYKANRPTAVVEVLDPMVLGSKVKQVCECGCGCQSAEQIPECICNMFDEELVLTGEKRRLFVTLGQFSIIRLERDAQLIIPVLDYNIPTKECCDTPGGTEDPCEMFSRIPFPETQFAPRDCDYKCDRDATNYTTTGCN